MAAKPSANRFKQRAMQQRRRDCVLRVQQPLCPVQSGGEWVPGLVVAVAEQDCCTAVRL